MRGVLVALAGGLVCIAAALGFALSEAPPTVAGTNGVEARHDIANTRGDVTVCQAGGTLPKGTSAIRVSFSANIGPRVSVEARAAGRLVAHGTRSAGWGISETVTVPVGRVPSAVNNVQVCATAGPAIENVEVNGTRSTTASTSGAVHHALALRLEYLRAGRSSWLSLASSVARHLGLGRDPSGTWLAFLVVAMMLLAAALTSRLLRSELR